MPQVHPTAILEGDIDLADDAVVGPWCHIDGTVGSVSVGPGTQLIGQAWLHGPLRLGAGNTIYPGVKLGFAPQSTTFDRRAAGRGLVVGDDNTFREGVTIHRAMTDDGPTTIGDRTFLMGNAHIGHDSRIADDAVIAQGAVLGGHAIVDERATIGGNVAVHQFVRIGRGAMLSGAMGITGNLPPFFMLTGHNLVGAVNLVGMRRMGFTADEIDDARWAYRIMFRRGLPLPEMLAVLRERAERPLIAEYVEFVETSKRNLCSGRYRAVRGEAPGREALRASRPVPR